MIEPAGYSDTVSFSFRSILFTFLLNQSNTMSVTAHSVPSLFFPNVDGHCLPFKSI
jgi:hypothetical protein